MRIHILTQRKLKAHYYNYPIRVFKRDIEKQGVNIHFFYDLDARRLTNCDVILIIRRHVKPDFLEAIRSSINHIVYFDVSASSGQLKANLMPWVDVYAKPQILKDRSLYLKDLYRRNLFTDFYHEEYGVVDHDEDDMRWELPTEHDLTKLRLAWNFGMADWAIDRESRLKRGLRMIFPSDNYKSVKHNPPNPSRKDIAMTYRMGKHPVPTIQYQRTETLERIETLDQSGLHEIAYGGRVTHAQFLDELTRAWIAPSPFGYGEMCQRDFEAMLQGSILLKPDMSHMETYPDYYRDGETYIAHQWDFSDFNSKVEAILANPLDYLHIAQSGYDFMMSKISPNNAEEFTRQFMSIIEV